MHESVASKPGKEAARADPSRPGARLLWRVGIVVVVALLAGAVVGSLIAFRQEVLPEPMAESSVGEPVSLEFTDAAGAAHSLADFRGKAVVLNLWATWCVPCREEMPTLDRLQAKLGGPEFAVVAVSVDRGGIARVTDFLDEIGTRHLTAYLADMAAVRSAVGVVGLPTTLLVDREGREVHRVVGPAEWDSPEKIALIGKRLDVAPASPEPERGQP